MVFEAQDPNVELYTKVTAGVVSVSHFGHPNRCVVLSHYCFMFLIVCIFVMTWDGEHLFICLFSIYMSSVVRCVFRSHFSIELFVFLLNVKSSLYSFNNSPLSDGVFLKYYLPVCDLSSNSLDVVYCKAEVLNSKEVQLISCIFHGSCLWCCI